MKKDSLFAHTELWKQVNPVGIWIQARIVVQMHFRFGARATHSSSPARSRVAAGLANPLDRQ